MNFIDIPSWRSLILMDGTGHCESIFNNRVHPTIEGRMNNGETPSAITASTAASGNGCKACKATGWTFAPCFPLIQCDALEFRISPPSRSRRGGNTRVGRPQSALGGVGPGIAVALAIFKSLDTVNVRITRLKNCAKNGARLGGIGCGHISDTLGDAVQTAT